MVCRMAKIIAVVALKVRSSALVSFVFKTFRV